MYTIYRILNSVNDKVYIGQTIQTLKERFRLHCWKKNKCQKISRAIQKYGKENFWIEPIQQNIISPDMACLWETFWIEAYDSVNSGYNINPNGNTGFTGNHTDEAKRKMSDSKLGKHYSPETEFSGGYHPATEIKKGQHLSEETEIKKGQHLSKKTEFKKGQIPWNKGKKKAELS